MTKPKYPSGIYAALKEAGLSNRQIGRELGVDEATVRRGLKSYVGVELTEHERALKRARDTRSKLTPKGRARTRRFRLREYLSRMQTRLKENP